MPALRSFRHVMRVPFSALSFQFRNFFNELLIIMRQTGDRRSEWVWIRGRFSGGSQA